MLLSAYLTKRVEKIIIQKLGKVLHSELSDMLGLSDQPWIAWARTAPFPEREAAWTALKRRLADAPGAQAIETDGKLVEFNKGDITTRFFSADINVENVLDQIRQTLPDTEAFSYHGPPPFADVRDCVVYSDGRIELL